VLTWKPWPGAGDDFFERPEDPATNPVTARNIELLRNIAQLRLPSAVQLAALYDGSARNSARALLAVFDDGYVRDLSHSAQSTRGAN
jgi:hypothetical protein